MVHEVHQTTTKPLIPMAFSIHRSSWGIGNTAVRVHGQIQSRHPRRLNQMQDATIEGYLCIGTVPLSQPSTYSVRGQYIISRWESRNQELGVFIVRNNLLVKSGRKESKSLRSSPRVRPFPKTSAKNPSSSTWKGFDGAKVWTEAWAPNQLGKNGVDSLAWLGWLAWTGMNWVDGVKWVGWLCRTNIGGCRYFQLKATLIANSTFGTEKPLITPRVEVDV